MGNQLMTNSNGVILYEGPSQLNGQPIVVIVTGLSKRSVNSKTGDMLQTWIMPAGEFDPLTAAQSGEDESVCGDCKMRPFNKGPCYVNLGQAPRNVWLAYKANAYPRSLIPASLGRGRFVRLGSYGDPAAVPLHVWRRLLAEASGWNGYTHQWRTSRRLIDYCMASCDSPEEAEEAREQGWRTFRVRSPDQPTMLGEFVCPASSEAGHKTTCNECKACGGLSSKARAHPVIMAHGATKKRFSLLHNGREVAA